MAAGRVACQNNLKQLALATLSYESAALRLPADRSFVAGDAERTWLYDLLPYLECPVVANLYDPSRSWDDPKNAPAVRMAVPMALCPQLDRTRTWDHRGSTYAVSDYATFPEVDRDLVRTGLLGAWAGDRTGALHRNTGRRMADITDGTSSTLLYAEVANRPQVWRAGRRVPDVLCGSAWASPDVIISFKGADATGDPVGPFAINRTNCAQPYSFHGSGTHFSFVDGHVRWYSDATPTSVAAALVTRSGGEVIPAGD